MAAEGGDAERLARMKERRKRSFVVETAAAPTAVQRWAQLSADVESGKFQALIAEEVQAVDPETGEAATWVRPHLRFDPSPDHVPPPPGPLPDDLKDATDGAALDPGWTLVQPMAVGGRGGSRASVLAKASAGTYLAPERAEVFKQSFAKRRKSYLVEAAAAPTALERWKKVNEDVASGRFQQLTAAEVTTIDPETGEAISWVRPELHYDPSSEHVPPPPPAPPNTPIPPPDAAALPEGAVLVQPMAVKSRAGRGSVLARASAGTYRKEGSALDATAVQMAKVQIHVD
jgi:hypothetical protein